MSQISNPAVQPGAPARSLEKLADTGPLRIADTTVKPAEEPAVFERPRLHNAYQMPVAQDPGDEDGPKVARVVLRGRPGLTAGLEWMGSLIDHLAKPVPENPGEQG
jgi:hypothetical protein